MNDLRINFGRTFHIKKTPYGRSRCASSWAMRMWGFTFVNGLIDGFVARIGPVWFMHSVLQRGCWGVWWGASLATWVCAAIGTVYFLSGR